MSSHDRYKPHGSIPGYRPGPILSRNQKTFLWGLVLVPAITYLVMLQRNDKRLEQEKSLEVEGREMWEKQFGKKQATTVEVNRSDG